jgi:hypothetical protein
LAEELKQQLVMDEMRALRSFLVEENLPGLTETGTSFLRLFTYPPLSAPRGFLGGHHFSKTNEFLLNRGECVIDWSLKSEVLAHCWNTFLLL